GWPLTVTDGTRVTGLAGRPPSLADSASGPDTILAVAEVTPLANLADARQDVTLLAESARHAGRHGRLRAEDHQLEILLYRLPEPVRRLRQRVLDPIAGSEELVRTVRAFVAHDYDRVATSQALHIHRNTLAYRLHRVEELAGLDFDRARDLACLYLAVAAEACDQPDTP
ncbi:MAG TPA: helix-turn-helix domain-containing protein, partial [Rugosimonospora sp.]|nr:helix-turn-helix domain-containing protein [Rugosimonospora sp.]